MNTKIITGLCSLLSLVTLSCTVYASNEHYRIGGFDVVGDKEIRYVRMNGMEGFFNNNQFTLLKFNDQNFSVIFSAAKGGYVQGLEAKVRSVEMKYKADCSLDRVKELSLTSYKDYFLKGGVRHSEKMNQKWQSPTSNSIVDFAMTQACKRYANNHGLYKGGFKVRPISDNYRAFVYDNKWAGSVMFNMLAMISFPPPNGSGKAWCILTTPKGEDFGKSAPNLAGFKTIGSRYEIDCKKMRARFLEGRMTKGHFLTGESKEEKNVKPFGGKWVPLKNRKLDPKYHQENIMAATDIEKLVHIMCKGK